MLLAVHCASTRRGCRYVKWRMIGIGNSTGGEWSSSLSCMDPTDKSYVVATEISLTWQRVRQFRVYRRQPRSQTPPLCKIFCARTPVSSVPDRCKRVGIWDWPSGQGENEKM